MPKATPGLLDRIKQQTSNRIRQEFAPNVPDYEGAGEQPSPSFLQKVKQKVKTLVEDTAPVADKYLDPAAPLDEPTIKYRIRYAARNGVLLYMKYNGQWRHVEPYSYRYSGKGRALRFYGHCRIHDVIHSFNLKKIEGLVVTDIPYSSRWLVELT